MRLFLGALVFLAVGASFANAQVKPTDLTSQKVTNWAIFGEIVPPLPDLTGTVAASRVASTCRR